MLNPNPGEGLNAIKVELINDNVSHLLGEVLTIIDASTEGEKNKAIKDLVRRAFSDKQSWFSELSWKELMKEGEAKSHGNDWEKNLVPLIYIKDEFYSFRD